MFLQMKCPCSGNCFNLYGIELCNMKISDVINYLESLASPALQESYDNSGLLTGNAGWDCTGVLVTLDAVEEVIEEAIRRQVNLVVAHHPIIFKGLKKLNGKNYVERTVIHAIKNDIAIYAIHTNLDNISGGVSGKMADMLGLVNRSVLQPKEGFLQKLHCFVPHAQLEKVRDAIFSAGGGHIGKYSHCSFSQPGTGTFKGQEGTNPFAGEPGKFHEEPESRLEVVFPSFLRHKVVEAMVRAHPYEEVAYDIISLQQAWPEAGSGMIGTLETPLKPNGFLQFLGSRFKLEMIRHTPFTGLEIKRVALCGGAGSFLLPTALARGADVFVTADMKYHEFFDAEGRVMVCDIGHYESEQFTIELLHEVLVKKFPNFALLKSGIKTNPVNYFRV